jgi:hypothetical protein
MFLRYLNCVVAVERRDCHLIRRVGHRLLSALIVFHLDQVVVTQIAQVWGARCFELPFGRWQPPLERPSPLVSYPQTELAAKSSQFVPVFAHSCFSPAIFDQAARDAIMAVQSELPQLKFIDLLAGWETFSRTGAALPRETVQSVTLSRHIPRLYLLVQNIEG